jgi:hypothetical protein
MSTIELSAGFFSGLSQRMFSIAVDPGSGTGRYPGTTFAQGTVDINQGFGGSNIILYKGTIPAAGQNINLSAQSANVLASWSPGSTGYNLTSCSYSNNSVTMSTYYVTASASGTASWFALVGGIGSTVYQSIYGNVGIQGSGADLEMATTSVLTGSFYRIQNLRFTLPTNWTY